MIDPHSFTTEWIMSHRKDKRFARINPPVLEKMIRAMALLEALCLNGLVFTFKGGTSLILLLPTPTRFSVDIDILTEHSQAELEECFDKIVNAGNFTSWELDKARSYNEGIPKAHYFFYYDSQLNQRASYILLDILFDTHKYPVINKTAIKSHWVVTSENPVTVATPSIESILGDKLTAFAPNTTGVPYGKDKSVEIVKQLHDVGYLFDHVQDVSVVARSFEGIVAQEIEYRALKAAADHVLDDIIATALLVGKTEKHHIDQEKVQFAEIRAGLDQFSGFLITGNFHIETAIESAAKAAYIAAKLKVKDYTPIERPTGEEIAFQFKDMPYNVLNRLRKFRNGSLHYWSKTAGLLGLE